jgi:hypothetical protein
MNASEIASRVEMPRLLERAGARIRGKRADCLKCTGHSRLTVSFTDEVAYCHRCGWKANVVLLARELGLLNDPEARAQLRREQAERERQMQPLREFEFWRDARERELGWKLYDPSRKAVVAGSVLKAFPDCEEAWDALARYYHAKADLHGALDFLACVRVSQWLEQDSNIEDVFSLYQEQARAK